MTSLLDFILGKEFISGAITGGGLLTIWKWVSGWNNTNLTLFIENRRTASGSRESDTLISVLRLKKGDRATLALHSVCLQFNADGKELSSQSLSEVKPIEVDRNLNLTPGEETHFAFLCTIPRASVCKVTATVIGKSFKTKFAPTGVWKATEISTPTAQGLVKI